MDCLIFSSYKILMCVSLEPIGAPLAASLLVLRLTTMSLNVLAAMSNSSLCISLYIIYAIGPIR